MKIAIVVNAARKNDKIFHKSTLDELTTLHHLSYELYLVEPEQFDNFFANLKIKEFNGFIIAGGDGTVRMAVQYLINEEVPLAILPLGTFNFFAKELNFPADINETFKMIKNNKLKLVDVAEVNNIVFINHSSIGFYTHILKARKKHKSIFGTSRFFKIAFTASNFFKVLPIYHLKIELDDKLLEVKTCLVFIGNNYHFTNLLDFGERQSLTSGKLSVYILNCKTRWAMFKCMLSMLFNTFDKSKYLSQYVTTQIIIQAESKLINVVLDGDLLKLESPLSYTIHNKKLTVYTP